VDLNPDLPILHVIILGKLFTKVCLSSGSDVVSQWPNGRMHDCGVRGPRLESDRGQLFVTTATAIYSLGHGPHSLTAVPRST